MSWGRIWGVILRYFYFFTRFDNIAEVFYWPTIDILLWGLTSVWIQSEDPNAPSMAIMILTGLVFWQLLWRANYEITVNLLQEFWNRNLVNLFSTPLKISEWMLATMIAGFVKLGVTLAFSALLVYAFFALNIFTLGWTILPFIGLITLSGWMIGFLSGSAMVYFGQRLQMLAWITPYIFAPFSAVFYPVSALPTWLQPLSWCLPTTYVFEGMRQVLTTGVFNMEYFWWGLGLNIFFLTAIFALFVAMFQKSRQKGLARLE